MLGTWAPEEASQIMKESTSQAFMWAQIRWRYNSKADQGLGFCINKQPTGASAASPQSTLSSRDVNHSAKRSPDHTALKVRIKGQPGPTKNHTANNNNTMIYDFNTPSTALTIHICRQGFFYSHQIRYSTETIQRVFFRNGGHYDVERLWSTCGVVFLCQ